MNQLKSYLSLITKSFCYNNVNDIEPIKYLCISILKSSTITVCFMKILQMLVLLVKIILLFIN